MTEKEIAAIVGKDRVIAGHLIVCANIGYLQGQQDVISVSKTGLLLEYEIKISRGDFFRDAGKARKVLFANPETQFENLPNHFYYVVPEDLISIEELPKYAGLYYITDGQMFLKKKAPAIHSYKHSLLKIYKKVGRINQERQFLGMCRLTYENLGIKERNKQRAKEYEQKRKDNHAIMKFKKP